MPFSSLSFHLSRVVRFWRINGAQPLWDRIQAEVTGRNGSPFLRSVFHRNTVLSLPIRYPAASLPHTRFSVLKPLRVFPDSSARRRITLFTDSINAGYLFGGVGTSLLLAASLAKDWDCDVRILTQFDKAQKSNLREVLEHNGIAFDREVEFHHVEADNPRSMLAVGDREIFLTTSWWTTESVRSVLPSSRILYLIQEDERAFYSFSEDRMYCSRVMHDPQIHFVVNTKLLFDFFTGEGFSSIRDHGVWFEPSFPRSLFYREETPRAGKKNFFFYARPHNPRNLFYLGVEVLERAITSGVLDPKEWNLLLVGSDVPHLEFSLSMPTQIFQNMKWSEYAALARQVDLGLSLMYSPHPSYPPLDLAASGAVAVTNRYRQKRNLDMYSHNILCADLDAESLLEAISRGIALVNNPSLRQAQYATQKLNRNWDDSFRNVLARFHKEWKDVFNGIAAD
jgi:O-antigen biosynthesis protein